MQISNQTTIDEWSKFSDEDLKAFGDEGDSARSSLLDPIILKLLGNIKGKTILDAGCGNGYLTRKLAKDEAQVTGLEPSTNLYQYCVKRESEESLGNKFIQADLTSFEAITQYDIVLLINVLMDIPDYEDVLKNCIKALKPGGQLILSILHPCFPGFEADWNKLGRVEIKEYFNAEPIKQKYGALISRPLQDYFNLLIDHGTKIERVIEPQSSDLHGTRNAHVPQFIVISVSKL